MPSARGQLGAWGEAAVVADLERRRFRIVARNQRIAGVEVDIVARKGRNWLVMEVKTAHGWRPEDSLFPKQIERLRRAAAAIPAAFHCSPRQVGVVLAAVSVAEGSCPAIRFFDLLNR